MDWRYRSLGICLCSNGQYRRVNHYAIKLRLLQINIEALRPRTHGMAVAATNPRPSVSEPVAETEPQHARLEAVADAGQPEGPVREVDEQVLDPRRPGRGEPDLHAAAGSPSGMGLVFRASADLGAAAAEREAERRINQNVVEPVARAPAQRAEPGVREFPRRKRVVCARQRQIGFAAEHEPAVLPVVAALQPAGDAPGTGGIVRGVAPLIAELASHIGASPGVSPGQDR